jgi:peptide deformylase
MTHILPLGDPRLREPAVPVADVADPQFQAESARLKRELDAFRAQHGFGRGVAAPQLGIGKRFIAINLGQGTRCLVNPEITWRSAETFTLWDDCMCFPTLLVKVRRNRSISLAFQGEDGRPQIWENLGQAESELLQHECDHLDGVLAIDRAEGENAIISRDAFKAQPEHFAGQVDYLIQPTLPII